MKTIFEETKRPQL